MHRLARTADTTVFPDFDAVGGSGDLGAVVGALLTIVLIIAVLMLVVCVVVWALSSSAGNYQAAGRARAGIWVSVGTAALSGAAVVWLDFLLDLGRSL